MTAYELNKQLCSTVNTRTRIKIINAARKYGLKDSPFNLAHFFGGYLPIDQLEEFKR